LASTIFMYILHVIIVSKVNTDLLYMIYIWDVSSFECKLSIDLSTSMKERERERDGLSLVFIDSYISVLTSRLCCSEAPLQLSEDITVFAICCILTGVISKEG